MFVFTEGNHKNHAGFANSYETADRLNYIQFMLHNEPLFDKKKLVFAKDSEFDISQMSKILGLDIQSISDKIIERYDSKNSWFCYHCTFENSLTDSLCTICQLKPRGTPKIIGNNGDTTYLSYFSGRSIVSTINTIIKSIDFCFEHKTDGFLLIRPPGHHSTMIFEQPKQEIILESASSHNASDDINIAPLKCIDLQCAGFCVINNIWIGAHYLRHKKFAKKIAIVDFDVHRGDGTQKMFYNSQDTLIVDIHQDNIYPKLDLASSVVPEHIINIPLKKGSDETAYLEVFDTIVLPKLRAFNPDVILVATGFDAHVSDPLGGMNLQSKSYGLFRNKLKSLDKQMIFFLEGGYDYVSSYQSMIEMIL